MIIENKDLSNLFKEQPLLVSNIILTQDKPIYGFYLLIKNIPGVLADITKLLADANINIVAINFTPTIEHEDVLLFIAADFSKSSEKPEVMVKKFTSLDNIVSATLVKPQVKGVLVDELHFPIIDTSGRRKIMLSQENLRFFVVGIRELLGSAGLALLYREGLVVGERIWKRYSGLGFKSLEEGLERLMIGSLVLGRYRGEIVKLSTDERRIIIRLYNNWECEVAKKHNILGPASYFEKGVLAGLIKGYTGKDVKIEEVKCIAKGDPYCEFEIQVG